MDQLKTFTLSSLNSLFSTLWFIYAAMCNSTSSVKVHELQQRHSEDNWGKPSFHDFVYITLILPLRDLSTV